MLTINFRFVIYQQSSILSKQYIRNRQREIVNQINAIICQRLICSFLNLYQSFLYYLTSILQYLRSSLNTFCQLNNKSNYLIRTLIFTASIQLAIIDTLTSLGLSSKSYIDNSILQGRAVTKTISLCCNRTAVN